MAFSRALAVLAMTCCLGLPASALAGDVVLRWTAPGDDSLTGRATLYDLRWAKTPITASNFNSATRVLGIPFPANPGVLQSWTVTGLDANVTHYFAIKTVDEKGNMSLISNLAVMPGTNPLDATSGLRPTGLSAPRPNPARATSRLMLSLAQATDVDVEVFDTQGRRVRTLLRGRWPAGESTVIWDLKHENGVQAGAGLYYVRARIGSEIFRHTIAVVR